MKSVTKKKEIDDSRFSLKRSAIGGSFWTIVGFVTSQSIRLAGNLILTRILFPEAFGIMALVDMIMQGIQMFSDFGIGAGVIRDRRGDDPRFLNTAWTIQVLRGFGLFFIACISSFPMAKIYDAPVLLQLIPVAGLSAVINGFTSVNVLTLRRSVNIKPLFIWETVSQACGLLCMIALAFYLRSVWALVFGGSIRVVIAASTSYFLVRGHKIHFAWDQSAVKSLIRFGKWIFLSTAVTFIIQKGDRAILGIFISKETLGLYSIATVWSRITIEALNRLNSQVLFPIYSMLHNRNDSQMRRRVFKARLCLICLFTPIAWALALGGQYLIDFIYDARYSGAGWMLQLLSIGAVGAAISATAGNILLSVGDSKRFMMLQVCRGVLLICCITLGASQAGEIGMVVGVTASKFCDYPLLALAIRRYGVWMPALDIGTIIVSAVVLIIGSVYLGLI